MYKKTKVCYYQTNERRKRGKEMLQTIENVNAVVNNFVWGVPAMVCIIGVGLVLSARTGFIQFRKFGYAIKNSIGRIFTKSEAKEGSITPFQAVCTALAATVGTGNIAGVAGAIAIGGAGAVFWMWVSALLGMCTKFSEVTLAVHYRERECRGRLCWGPDVLYQERSWQEMVLDGFGLYSALLPGKLCSTFAVEIKVNNRFSLGIGFYRVNRLHEDYRKKSVPCAGD